MHTEDSILIIHKLASESLPKRLEPSGVGDDVAIITTEVMRINNGETSLARNVGYSCLKPVLYENNG